MVDNNSSNLLVYAVDKCSFLSNTSRENCIDVSENKMSDLSIFIYSFYTGDETLNCINFFRKIIPRKLSKAKKKKTKKTTNKQTNKQNKTKQTNKQKTTKKVQSFLERGDDSRNIHRTQLVFYMVVDLESLSFARNVHVFDAT